MAAADERRRNPTACNAPDIRHQVNDDDGQTDLQQGKPMAGLKKPWHPEKIKPPHRINNEFSKSEGPRLAMFKKTQPTEAGRRIRRVAANVLQFFRRATGVIFRLAVNP